MTIRARLYVIPSEFGGRKGYITDGYRPDWKLPGDPGLHCAALELETDIHSGHSGEAVLKPFRPEFWKSQDLQGKQILMFEGARCVGVAFVYLASNELENL